MANITVNYGTVGGVPNFKEQTVTKTVYITGTTGTRTVVYTYDELNTVYGIKEFDMPFTSSTYIIHLISATVVGNTVKAIFRHVATGSSSEEISLTAIGV